mmetsp:Transcript_12219/g.29058  ORF Transcript_12219/g.29058 Transcript_12219/m.29058 type:complete len:237 (+) Transcript_12219:863-1573(+)
MLRSTAGLRRRRQLTTLRRSSEKPICGVRTLRSGGGTTRDRMQRLPRPLRRARARVVLELTLILLHSPLRRRQARLPQRTVVPRPARPVRKFLAMQQGQLRAASRRNQRPRSRGRRISAVRMPTDGGRTTRSWMPPKKQGPQRASPQLPWNGRFPASPNQATVTPTKQRICSVHTQIAGGRTTTSLTQVGLLALRTRSSQVLWRRPEGLQSLRRPGKLPTGTRSTLQRTWPRARQF